MDEWRVHVGIGLVRAQMGLERWNQEREDAPEEFKQQAKEKTAAKKSAKATEETAPVKAEAQSEELAATVETPAVEEPPKKKRGRKPKAETTTEE